MEEINKGEIVIYPASQGPELQVSIQGDSVWLTLNQIAQLFGRDKSVISRHIKNVFKTAELSQNSVVAKNATTASDGKTYMVEYYNLDLIISVGYRVNSKRGTQFRIWATRRLRDYLLKGYALNQQRLKERQEVKLKELEGAIKLLQGAVETNRLAGYEKELLKIITDYTQVWITLNRYDQGRLEITQANKRVLYRLDYEKIKRAIEQFTARLIKIKEAGDLFGREVEHKLKAILGNIEQTFGGKALYKSVEEKAAHLLYFAVKDHPFADGNKRIGSLLFLLYLVENRYLYNKRGERKFNDNALTALVLLLAESRPEQKEVMVKLIGYLIGGE